MPAKLRKMLGDINAPVTAALMRLMETQSQRTLTDWAEAWARAQYLPLLEQAAPGDALPRRLLDATRGYLNGETPLKDVKALIRDVRSQCAAFADPVALASARAISTGCAACTTATNALGCLFYGAAACAYAKAGADAEASVYDALADAHLHAALAALERCAVPNEPNPARINWNC